MSNGKPMKIHHMVAFIASGWILSASQAGICELPRLKPSPPPLAPPPEVFLAPVDFAQQKTAITLIDIRSVEQYAAGHWPGAISLPASTIHPESPEPLRRRLAEMGLSGKETVALCGAIEEPEELGWAFLALSVAGFREIRAVKGGYDELEQVAQPKSAHFRSLVAAKFEVSAQTELVVGVEELLTLYGQEGVEVLDLRQDADWEAYALPALFRAGHIPHSLPFSAHSLLGRGGSWPEPLALRERLSALGPRASEPVNLRSTFILVGKDSLDRQVGLAYLLFRSMGLEVRFLAGGWAGWQATSDVPRVQVVDALTVQRLLVAENPDLADLTPNKVLLLDLREDWYFEESHLPGAVFLSAFDFEEQFEQLLQRHWPEIDRKRAPLILYCFGPGCTRSRRCATWASQLGFRKLLWFRGGIDEWQQAKFRLYGSLWEGPSEGGQTSPREGSGPDGINRRLFPPRGRTETP